MEMNNDKRSKRLKIITATVAIIFGLLTVIAGSRVLIGLSEPGYTLFLPLVIFNTIMGLFYIAAGMEILRNTKKGAIASKVIFMLNLSVLCLIFLIFISSDQVALDSILAMVFRTTVWLGMYWSLKQQIRSVGRTD
jgi:hypothetical protein